MTISGITPAMVAGWFNNNMNRARTYETLLFCLNRGGSQHYSEHGEIEIRLGWIAKQIDTAKSSVHRHLHWLNERGFIRIRKEPRLRGGFVLWIKVLVKPLKRWVELAWNSGGTRVERNTPLFSENTLDTPTLAEPPARQEDAGENSPVKDEEAPPAPPTVTSMVKRVGLSGKVAGAADRLKAKAAGRKTKDTRPTPTEAAHEWNKLLREWGDHPFTIEPKTLAHVRQTLAHVQPKDLQDFRDRLDKAVEWWSAHHAAHGKLKGQPAHPWVLNRNLDLAFAPAPAIFKAPEPAPAATPTAPPTVAQPAQMSKHKGNGLLGMFQKGKKKYGGGIPQAGED